MDLTTALKIAQQVMNDPSDYEDGVSVIFQSDERFNFHEQWGDRDNPYCVICENTADRCLQSLDHSTKAIAKTGVRQAYNRISQALRGRLTESMF